MGSVGVTPLWAVGGAAASAMLWLIVRKLYQKTTIRSRLEKAFSKKVVCITGASSGIGKQLAIQAFDLGAKLILVARREELLENLKKNLLEQNLTRNHEDICIVVADLADIDNIPNISSQVLEKYGRVDILINNAGMAARGSVENTPMELHQRVMNVNYFSVVALTKELLPSLTSRTGSSIVAVSSLMGKVGVPYNSSYAASKHALQGFCDSLRPEIHDKGVNVLIASPGYVNTEIAHKIVLKSGKMADPEKSVMRGMSAAACASRIMRGVAYREKDINITDNPQFKLALYIRLFVPAMFYRSLNQAAVQMRRRCRDL